MTRSKLLIAVAALASLAGGIGTASAQDAPRHHPRENHHRVHAPIHHGRVVHHARVVHHEHRVVHHAVNPHRR